VVFCINIQVHDTYFRNFPSNSNYCILITSSQQFKSLYQTCYWPFAPLSNEFVGYGRGLVGNVVEVSVFFIVERC
jgi:hypothetical protein